MKLFSSLFLLILCMLSLSACSMGLVEAGAGTYGIMTGTKPDELPPPDTDDQIAAHESWCYETMGYTECYAHPQPGDPNRLVNVDPANRYPLTPQAYRNAVVESREYP